MGQLDWSRLDLGTEWEEKGISVVSVDSRAEIPAGTGVRNAREQHGQTPSWLACRISGGNGGGGDFRADFCRSCSLLTGRTETLYSLSGQQYCSRCN